MKTIQLSIFGAITLALLFTASFAVKPALGGPNDLRVPISPYAPWRIINDDGTMEGVDIDVLRELCKRMKLNLKLEQTSFARGMIMLEDGHVDVGCSLQKRPERQTYLHYIEPPYITGSDKVFYVLKGKENHIRRYEDLRFLRIGVPPGIKLFPRFDKDSTLTKIIAKNDDHLIKMLLNGRIDTFVYSESVGDYLVKTKRSGRYIKHAHFRFTKILNGYLVLSKKSPFASRLTEFNHTLKGMIEDGTIKRIMHKYTEQ